MTVSSRWNQERPLPESNEKSSRTALNSVAVKEV